MSRNNVDMNVIKMQMKDGTEAGNQTDLSVRVSFLWQNISGRPPVETDFHPTERFPLRNVSY